MISSTDVHAKFEELQTSLNWEILERYSEIHTSVIAILARKHHFQIGPPGTAKSLLVDRISKRINGLDEDGYFRWLLTNYTTPEELYGGPDFQLLRDRGIYKRVTDRKLPKARFVFLDEIFKGNSAVLNANLTAMNERMFFNHDDDPKIPLISLFAASNELPHGDELWALWDRLHFRHQISPVKETTSFVKLMSSPMEKEPEAILSLEDIEAAHKYVDAVTIGPDIIEAIKQLREDLKEEGVEPSERRWVETLPIIKAEAWFNGRDEADVEDVRPLMHVLWPVLDQQKIVKRKVLELANPVDKEASEVYDRLCELTAEFKKNLASTDNPKDRARIAVEVFSKVKKADELINKLKEEVEATGKKSEYLAGAEMKFKELGETLMKEGFNKSGKL